MIIQKFRIFMRKFCTFMRHGPRSCGCYCCSIDFTRSCEIGFLMTMQNWLSSREMIVLLLNSRLLNGKAFGFLRWCQVSTWPWLINRNLNISLKSFWTLLIPEFSIFYLWIELSIFHHFLTSQICLVRPNLQIWVAKSLFSWRKEDLMAKSMVN